MEQITFTVNGEARTVSAEPDWTLLYILREVLGLTGAKCGCDTHNCGACRVIVDGNAVNSCAVKAKTLGGKRVETIEGLAVGLTLHPLQLAFVETGAVQCGYCTPGMVMSAKALLDKNPDPDEADIRRAVNGNLCRCTGYVKIVEAVQLAAKRMREEAK